MRTQSKETQHGLRAARALANLKERNEPFVNDVKTIRTSRREFVRLSGLAVGAAGLTLSSSGLATAQPASDRNPDAVLTRLIEGNKRFMSGQPSLLSRRRPEDFAALAEGQAPLAVIVGCADSRVAPELIFDQGVGDLFVVRVAGNIVSGAAPP